MLKRHATLPRRRSTFRAPAVVDVDVQHAVDRALAAPAPATTPIDVTGVWAAETPIETVTAPAADLTTGLIELPPTGAPMPRVDASADAASGTRAPKHRAERVRNRRPSKVRYSLAS